MDEELKPNSNWSPKDDPDYRPDDETPKSDKYVIMFARGFLAVLTGVLMGIGA